MRQRKVSAEQKQKAVERRQKLRSIARSISKMTPDERTALVHDWPTTIEGHRLSLHNACMIIMQGGNGSVYGGFQQWRKAGRMVRKGEHGYGIWFPIGKDKTDEGETIHEDSELRFSVATVFDISQTESLTSEVS